jgi:hypothetical protein
MSVIYLSFGSIAELHNNSKEAVSPIGELTNKSRTYAKDPAVFSITDAISATTLYNFLSQRDTVDIPLPPALAKVQINISNWLFAQAKTGNITGSRANTLALLKATFTANIEILDVGEMVTNNTYWMPSFVLGNHIVGAEKQQFILWLADAYFLDQYPEVSFAIVHPLPLTEMDTLMTLNFQQIEKRLALETPDIIERRTKELTQQAAWPYTEREIIPFAIMDLINTPNFNLGYWTWVEWGNGADAEDKLFEQMQNEILAASQYPRAKWEEKIPDLFNPLEFYVIPYFNRIGLVDKTNGASSYSPIADRETMMVLVDKYLTPNMTSDHVIKSMQVVPFLYKSIHCAFVSKLNNRNGMKKITNLFPDYSLTESTDPDFQKMNLTTMEFIRQMENLLAAAEVVTPISLPPIGITRITRFGKTYVARRIGKVKIIVMTRWQMIEDGVVEA